MRSWGFGRFVSVWSVARFSGIVLGDVGFDIGESVDDIVFVLALSVWLHDQWAMVNNVGTR